MAATIARPHIYEAFLGDVSASRQFFHGHTFGGNPLAAAAALASIELFEETDLLATINAKAEYLRDQLSQISDHPHVGNIRGRGLMVGIEIVKDREAKTCYSPDQLIGRRICEKAIDRGVWLRPLSDVVVLMPPPVATEAELDVLADVTCQAIESFPWATTEQVAGMAR
jgi:adenosylmethionine-8-amino-7-oxononanoate aminotransferase